MYVTRSLLKLIDFILYVVSFLLGIRILLRLFGANPRSPFVDWLYDTTAPLIAPFVGAFPNPVIERGFVIEFASIFALVIYAFLAYLISVLIAWIGREVRRHEREHGEREVVRHDTHRDSEGRVVADHTTVVEEKRDHM